MNADPLSCPHPNPIKLLYLHNSPEFKPSLILQSKGLYFTVASLHREYHKTGLIIGGKNDFDFIVFVFYWRFEVAELSDLSYCPRLFVSDAGQKKL